MFSFPNVSVLVYQGDNSVNDVLKQQRKIKAHIICEYSYSIISSHAPVLYVNTFLDIVRKIEQTCESMKCVLTQFNSVKS